VTGGRVALTETVNDARVTGDYVMRTSSTNSPAGVDPIDSLAGPWEASILEADRSPFIDYLLPETVQLD
jgi:hypothetical protein